MTGFGLGWVNAAADYSRYLPRSTARQPWRLRLDDLRRRARPGRPRRSSGCCSPGSSQKLSAAIGADPIGALTTILPDLVPDPVRASSRSSGSSAARCSTSTRRGLALLTAGIRIPRSVAAGVDGVVDDRRRDLRRVLRAGLLEPVPGVPRSRSACPIAAWCGVFIARLPAAPHATTPSAELLRPARPVRLGPRGRPCSSCSSAPRVGWGLVTNSYGVPSGSTGRATCSARSAAGPARGRTRTSACSLALLHRLRRHARPRPRRRPPAGGAAPVPARMRHRTSSSSTCSACSPTRTAPGPRPGTPPRRRASAACCPRSPGATVFTRFVAPAEPDGRLDPLLPRLAGPAAARRATRSGTSPPSSRSGTRPS